VKEKPLNNTIDFESKIPTDEVNLPYSQGFKRTKQNHAAEELDFENSDNS